MIPFFIIACEGNLSTTNKTSTNQSFQKKENLDSTPAKSNQILLSEELEKVGDNNQISNKAKSNHILFSEELEKVGDDNQISNQIKSMDEIINDVFKEILFDTVGLYNSPVKVLSAKLFTEEYSNYRNIRLTYKNVSNKRVEAIRFRWYGLNAFNEPADMGSYVLTKGFGSGFVDSPLEPGKSVTNSWNILSKDGKRVVLAWPYEVAFTDGSIWKCGKR